MKKLLSGLLLIYSTSTFSAIFPNNHKDICNEVQGGKFCIPFTDSKYPRNTSLKWHTNNMIFVPDKSTNLPNRFTAETPGSIACIYGLTQSVPGCRIQDATTVPTGGWGAIGIVDYGYDSTLEPDLLVFSQKYGLPACTLANGCLTYIYVTNSGGQPGPPPDGGVEEHIDVEWAHAMAPNAKLIVVLGDSSKPLTDLIDAASTAVANAGGGEVSISYGQAEYNGETNNDSHFLTPGIVYFVSAGDSGAPAKYPSASPNVVSAGGTEILRDAQGNFVEEDLWNANGKLGSGGPSLYESRPSYQNSVQKIVGTQRGTPDISFAAYSLALYSTNPDSSCNGWCYAFGTSISAPGLAGIINSANQRLTSSDSELTMIYNLAIKHGNDYWHNITVGNNGYPSFKGYNFCNGIGTPQGYIGK